MPARSNLALRWLPLAAWLSVAVVAAQAAEVVTLRNGFTVTCRQHTQISAQTLRLTLGKQSAHTGAEAAPDNYMDVALNAVTSIEVVGEPASPSAANAATPSVTALSTPALLQRSGSAHNVNVALLASVVQAESAGNAHAVSRTGARGLMQLMPATAAELGVRDSFAPAQNVEGGSAYLASLLTRYHDDVALALAAYNAGPATVDRYHGVPPYRETRLYVARVVREFNRLMRLQAASASTATAAVLSGPAR